ncbi:MULTISPECIES: NAD(P)/FAD-dependent oxidoreductase [unclassified Ruminococcus]|uniref:NAD(P)/FAD-dependent oxidoreductase n=1 Tax=unclassified Ruminococcus TaxID=2608920 RepID=UPI00210E3132|nr:MULTISPECIES: NAD(P)/FAD-dependent oxidoreductase [unclassified Ruminococcus]MCQ4021850.1 aminoacetone oxidase family FAD-binding enzyme [Ruminococcus sp. zg-924]MCQ4114295.1 aminoacetone oxidase family FAD-binding enzyme [Ruminococcus sp. zg-921]
MSKTVVIIGAGASGMMAAHFAAQNGARVILLEKNKKVCRKVMITGKGRCNVTNNSSPDNLISKTPTNGRFLYSAVNSFTPADTMDFFESAGVALKTERGNRVFPSSDKASDIVDALLRTVKRDGCKILNEKQAKSLIIADNRVCGVYLTDGTEIKGDSVIVACGGASYPKTGSNGDGYMLAKQAGHTIKEIKPSLVPLECKGNTCARLQGLSLKNVNLSVHFKNGKKPVFSEQGEMLFTHFGISGPLVLSASSHMKKGEVSDYTITVDLKPALDIDTLDKRLVRDFDEFCNKDFANSLGKLLPSKLIPVIIERSKIAPTEKCNSITKQQRTALATLIKGFEVVPNRFRPIDEAIITSGGVNTKEINPKTMESKLIGGLYFAGEVIDVDAYTGGYNLQIAFSTGALAGQNSVLDDF